MSIASPYLYANNVYHKKCHYWLKADAKAEEAFEIISLKICEAMKYAHAAIIYSSKRISMSMLVSNRLIYVYEIVALCSEIGIVSYIRLRAELSIELMEALRRLKTTMSLIP